MRSAFQILRPSANLSVTLGLSIFLWAASASALLTVQESNDITKLGNYKLGFEPQLITADGGGVNFSGFIDKGINDEMSARLRLGAGDTDFSAGGSLKWVPFPDYGQQPAVGGKVGGYFWRESEESYFTVRVEPIVSKRFETGIGEFTPYASLPLMLNSGKDKNNTSMQLVGGTEFFHSEADNMTFGAEFGIDTKDSFSYVSGYVTIFLDEYRPEHYQNRNDK
jgi:hypothetical protein